MKAASISEIKTELKGASAAQLTELCLRLARYKKDNKELLTFLLFEATDLESYISSCKVEQEESFSEINTNNLYWAKKSLRKILRTTNKYIKYTGSKTVEAELLIHYCTLLKDSRIAYKKSMTLLKLYQNQVKKVKVAVGSFHEDLQYDYTAKLAHLEE